MRTPFGRFGGALAGVRPDDLAAHALKRAARARRRPRPGARSTTSSSATPTAPARTTATSPAWRCCSPGCRPRVPGATVNRLCGSSLEAAIQATRAIETGDAERRRRRRRRVDEPRALGAAEARARLPRRPRDALLDDARLAHGQPADARASGRSRSARAPRSSPTSTRSRARRRTRSPCAATSSPPRPGTRASSPRSSRSPASSSSATRASAPTPRWRSSRKLKPAFVEDGTVTAGNSSPLNDGAAMLLLGDEAAAGAARARRRSPASSRRGVHGVDPDVFGIAPVEAANKALAARRHRLGRRRRRRAERGLRLAVARLPRGLARARPGAR